MTEVEYPNSAGEFGSDEESNATPPTEETPVEKPKGLHIVESFRLHHANGGTFTDFENEDDLLDFVKEATTVKKRRNADGSTENVFSPNTHLVHGAAHPDYPNLRVEKVSEVVFPEDDE